MDYTHEFECSTGAVLNVDFYWDEETAIARNAWVKNSLNKKVVIEWELIKLLNLEHEILTELDSIDKPEKEENW